MKRLSPKKANDIYMLMLVVGDIIGFIGAWLEINMVVVVGIIIILSSIIFRAFFTDVPIVINILTEAAVNTVLTAAEKLRKTAVYRLKLKTTAMKQT